MNNHTLRQMKWILCLCFLFIAPSIAKDVCCVLEQKNQDRITTTTAPTSMASCKKGANILEGYSVCKAVEDPKNTCAELSEELRCKHCGYFWNGSCLVQDPVEVAKEQLKKEEEKKKKEAKSN